MNLAGDVVILTGPPGAGKSTAAAALAASSGAPKVHLQADEFWRCIRHGAIAPYLPAAHAQNQAVIEILAEAAAGYARAGYLVIVDGIIGPWFLPPFMRLRVPLHYLVLRPPLTVAIERCRTRVGDTLRDPQAIAALHRQFAALGALEPHVIETEGLDPNQTLVAIEHALSRGARRLTRGNAT